MRPVSGETGGFLSVCLPAHRMQLTLCRVVAVGIVKTVQ